MSVAPATVLAIRLPRDVGDPIDFWGRVFDCLGESRMAAELADAELVGYGVVGEALLNGGQTTQTGHGTVPLIEFLRAPQPVPEPEPHASAYALAPPRPVRVDSFDCPDRCPTDGQGHEHWVHTDLLVQCPGRCDQPVAHLQHLGQVVPHANGRGWLAYAARLPADRRHRVFPPSLGEYR